MSSSPDNGEIIFDILVRETNLYAEKSMDDANLPPKARAHSWRPTNGIEMKAFIGIILAMGILTKPTLESHWKEGTQSWLINTPMCLDIMRKTRFQNLLHYPHCNDNENPVSRCQHGHDPAHKIRPVLDLINSTFSHHYGLGRDVTVDESIVGFKGRNSLVYSMSA